MSEKKQHLSARLKQELAQKFPNVKFYVSSSRGSGSSLRVSWDFGPTTKQVEALTSKYEAGHFNGMEDIYEYKKDAHPDAVMYMFEDRDYKTVAESASKDWNKEFWDTENALMLQVAKAICDSNNQEWKGQYTPYSNSNDSHHTCYNIGRRLLDNNQFDTSVVQKFEGITPAAEIEGIDLMGAVYDKEKHEFTYDGERLYVSYEPELRYAVKYDGKTTTPVKFLEEIDSRINGILHKRAQDAAQKQREEEHNFKLQQLKTILTSPNVDDNIKQLTQIAIYDFDSNSVDKDIENVKFERIEFEHNAPRITVFWAGLDKLETLAEFKQDIERVKSEGKDYSSTTQIEQIIIADSVNFALLSNCLQCALPDIWKGIGGSTAPDDILQKALGYTDEQYADYLQRQKTFAISQVENDLFHENAYNHATLVYNKDTGDNFAVRSAESYGYARTVGTASAEAAKEVYNQATGQLKVVYKAPAKPFEFNMGHKAFFNKIDVTKLPSDAAAAVEKVRSHPDFVKADEAAVMEHLRPLAELIYRDFPEALQADDIATDDHIAAAEIMDAHTGAITSHQQAIELAKENIENIEARLELNQERLADKPKDKNLRELVGIIKEMLDDAKDQLKELEAHAPKMATGGSLDNDAKLSAIVKEELWKTIGDTAYQINYLADNTFEVIWQHDATIDEVTGKLNTLTHEDLRINHLHLSLFDNEGVSADEGRDEKDRIISRIKFNVENDLLKDGGWMAKYNNGGAISLHDAKLQKDRFFKLWEKANSKIKTEDFNELGISVTGNTPNGWAFSDGSNKKLVDYINTNLFGKKITDDEYSLLFSLANSNENRESFISKYQNINYKNAIAHLPQNWQYFLEAAYCSAQLRKYRDIVEKLQDGEKLASGGGLSGHLSTTYTNPVEYLHAMLASVPSDLNYSTEKSGINYYIGYKGPRALVVAFIEDENNYTITKEDAREMALTAKTKGIDTIELYTNYGIELHSRHEKPKDIGFDKIYKVSVGDILKDGGHMNWMKDGDSTKIAKEQHETEVKSLQGQIEYAKKMIAENQAGKNEAWVTKEYQQVIDDNQTRIIELTAVLDNISKMANGGSCGCTHTMAQGGTVGELKVGDTVKFIKKTDKNDVINAEVTGINPTKIEFINLDYPNVGLNYFSAESLDKHYDIEIVKTNHAEGGDMFAKGGVINADDFTVYKKHKTVMPSEKQRVYYEVWGEYKNYSFIAKTDNSFKFGYGSHGINKGSVYKLSVWKDGNTQDGAVCDYDNKWDTKPSTASDKAAVNQIVNFLDTEAFLKTTPKKAPEHWGTIMGNKYEYGGGIENEYEGKSPEEVFNAWSIRQKEHFFTDHEPFLEGESFSDVRQANYSQLSDKVKNRVDIHVAEGQYKLGGEINIEYTNKIIDEYNNKEITAAQLWEYLSGGKAYYAHTFSGKEGSFVYDKLGFKPYEGYPLKTKDGQLVYVNGGSLEAGLLSSLEKTSNGVYFSEDIISSQGAGFILYPTNGQTKQDIDTAKKQLRDSRNVVSMQVASDADWDDLYKSAVYLHPQTKPLKWYEIDESKIHQYRKNGKTVDEYVQEVVLPNIEQTRKHFEDKYGKEYISKLADGGLVGGYNLKISPWEPKSHNHPHIEDGKVSLGTIRTTPQSYYVATIYHDGTVATKGIEANTKDIPSSEVQQWYDKNKLSESHLQTVLQELKESLNRQTNGSVIYKERKEAIDVLEAYLATNKMAEGGWFKEAVAEKEPNTLKGWKKDMPARKRRAKALASRPATDGMDARYLSAARALQALANVTQDEDTKEAAHSDAEYFYDKSKKKASGGTVQDKRHRRVAKSCPVGTEIQSLMFDNSKFSKTTSRNWLKKHGFKFEKLEITATGDYLHYPQEKPDKFTNMRTIELTKGIKAHVGCPKL